MMKSCALRLRSQRPAVIIAAPRWRSPCADAAADAKRRMRARATTAGLRRGRGSSVRACAASARLNRPLELRGPSGPLPDAISLLSRRPRRRHRRLHRRRPPPAATAAAAATSASAAASATMAPAPTATVVVGVQPDYTRLAFRFAGPTSVTPTMQGNRLELRFSRAADIDIAELRAEPPRFVREVRRLSSAGAQVRVASDARSRRAPAQLLDGDRVVIDLLPPEEGAQSGRDRR